jgi:hypothetical protein
MIILRTIISVIVLLFIIVYVSFVLLTTNPCQRIDRATMPVRYAAEFAKTAAKPWSTPESLTSIDQWSVRTRFSLAILFRIQFYSDVVPPIRCDWDQHKALILGPDSSLIKREEANEAKRLANNEDEQ